MTDVNIQAEEDSVWKHLVMHKTPFTDINPHDSLKFIHKHQDSLLDYRIKYIENIRKFGCCLRDITFLMHTGMTGLIKNVHEK